MELKRLLAVCSFLALVLIASLHFVQAEIPSDVPFAQQTEQAQNFIEERKWEFIGQQWQELLLQNKFIKPVDALFHKINFAFVFLFARDYTFGLEMFFAFLWWMFTYFSLI